MRAIMKSIHSPDVEDLIDYIPEDKNKFCLLVEFTAGPEAEVGEEIFAIEVCTPLWLTTFLKPNEIVFGRNFLFMLNYDYNLIYNKIKCLVESFEADNWVELALKISRFASWEFEDYQ